MEFEWDGYWITNPYLSECGRFEVDPITYYGLSEEELTYEPDSK